MDAGFGIADLAGHDADAGALFDQFPVNQVAAGDEREVSGCDVQAHFAQAFEILVVFLKADEIGLQQIAGGFGRADPGEVIRGGIEAGGAVV